MPVRMPAAFLLLACIATPAWADWEVRAVPYLWMSGLDGEAAAVPSLPPAEVDASFGDVIGNLDIAFFGAAEARNGMFFLRGDVSYASLTLRGETPRSAFSGVKLNAEVFNLAVAPGAVIVDRNDLRIDIFAGARYWDISNRIDFDAGLLPARSVESDASFLNPIVGATVKFPVAKRLDASATASLGGFGVGADMEYDLRANLFYNLGDHWGLTAGYRYFSVDYDDGKGFVYDMAQHGPYIGAFFDF